MRQFSLKAALLGVMMVAIALGLWGEDRRRFSKYSQSIEFVQRIGGHIQPGKRELMTFELIDLSNTTISDADLINLCGFKYGPGFSLNLQNTSIGDPGLRQLVGLPIKRINVHHTQVTSSGVDGFRDSMPDVIIEGPSE